MSEEQPTQVGQLLRELREGKGMSVRGLAAAAQVDSTWLSRVEHGIYVNPDPRYLHRLAKVLGVETMDLFQAAEYGEGLPSFAPYLRSKYDLPAEAVEQLNAHFELLADKYDLTKGGDDDERDSTAA
jgi:transcriptional regulator with XRE-family HTH domain